MFPRIIYGTAWKKERTKDLVVTAVLQGFRAIDTACQPKHYQEVLVGEALDVLYNQHGFKREDFWLQTKFTSIDGQDTSKPLPYNPSSSITDQVKQSFATSLDQLKTNYIDSYILHSPLRTIEQTLEAWEVLKSLQDSGSVKLIGVSNTYDVETLEILETVGGRKPQVVQNRWFERNGWDKPVVKYCKNKNIHYESFWTLTGSPSLLAHPSLTSFASAKSITNEQAVYRLAQQWGITPLAGSTNEVHMKDGVQVEHVEVKDEDVPTDLRKLVCPT